MCSSKQHLRPRDTFQVLQADPTMHQLTEARATLLEAQIENYKAQLAEMEQHKALLAEMNHDNHRARNAWFRRRKWTSKLVQQQHRKQNGTVIHRENKTRGRFRDLENTHFADVAPHEQVSNVVGCGVVSSTGGVVQTGPISALRN